MPVAAPGKGLVSGTAHILKGDYAHRAAAKSVKILRCADYRRMPRKNGGGETAEIAVSPPDAGTNEFDWRISMAMVKADGPFSTFPGIDRTLSILEGQGLELAIGSSRHRLTQDSPPFPFPGDVSTNAVLIDSAITDLNAMSRRTTSRHDVRRLCINGTEGFTWCTAGVVALFCHRGPVSITIPLDSVVLGTFDTLIDETPGGEGSARQYRIAAKAPAIVHVISVTMLV